MEVSAEGKLVTMRFEGGDTFTMRTEGRDTTTRYPILREAIQRTFPTLVRISQLTEPDRIYGTEIREKGKRKIGWVQAVYPLRAQLQELKETNLHPERWDDTLEDELIDIRSGEQAFMTIRPKLIRAGYTTLELIPRIQKGSGIRFFCPPLKGVDSKTQESATRWIRCYTNSRLIYTHWILKTPQRQRDPEIEQLGGTRTSKLEDKYILKRKRYATNAPS